MHGACWAILAIALVFSACSAKPEAGPAQVYFVPNDRKEGIPANPVQEYVSAAGRHGSIDFTVTVNSKKEFQTMAGIGGAFNENGGEALAALTEPVRQQVLHSLFSHPDGAGFSFCRLPIGASDFALAAYSYSEVPDDWDMKHFALVHDEKYLIPFAQAALKINPRLRIFASPWSPPGWMKYSGKMDSQGLANSLRDEPAVYQAYALYFEKYLRGYADRGIPIERVMIQNEPDVNPVYPGCVMAADQIVKFTVEYLTPRITAAGLKTEIWGGTFREVDSGAAHECMADERFRRSVRGLGVQYAQTEQVADLFIRYPATPLMHTESVCFDGENSAEQGRIRLGEILSYLNAGCETFVYWNMILNESGKSAWDWRQNCLINIDRATASVTYNPDYAVMCLVSRFVRPGARRIEVQSNLAPIGAFRHPDGTVVILGQNISDQPKSLRIVLDGREHRAELPAHADAVIEIRPVK